MFRFALFTLKVQIPGRMLMQQKLTTSLLTLVLFTLTFAAQTIGTIEGPVFSSNPIARGSDLGISSKITNTDTKRHRFTLTVTATSNCDSNNYFIDEGSFSIDAGKAIFASNQWPIPANACVGNYTVLMTLTLGNQSVASTSGVLSVTN